MDQDELAIRHTYEVPSAGFVVAERAAAAGKWIAMQKRSLT